MFDKIYRKLGMSVPAGDTNLILLALALFVLIVIHYSFKKLWEL